MNNTAHPSHSDFAALTGIDRQERKHVSALQLSAHSRPNRGIGSHSRMVRKRDLLEMALVHFRSFQGSRK
jgi:hypothetical protein